MQLSLQLTRLLILALPLWLTACGTNYSVLPEKAPPGDSEVKKSPQQFRIKRIVYEGAWATGATTELAYGSNGKVSQARYVGHDFGKGAPLGVFTYGAVATITGDQLTGYKYQYPQADSRGYVAEQTSFSYFKTNSPDNLGADVLSAQTDFLKADGTPKLLKRTTTYSTNNLISTVRYEDGNTGVVNRAVRYSFNAGNLVSIQSTVGPNQTETYTFDDKPNPFFGLFGPDITPVRQHSRNNVTGVTIKFAQGNVQTYSVVYEYNSGGLPVSAKFSNGTIRFEYEAY